MLVSVAEFTFFTSDFPQIFSKPLLFPLVYKYQFYGILIPCLQLGCVTVCGLEMVLVNRLADADSDRMTDTANLCCEKSHGGLILATSL